MLTPRASRRAILTAGPAVGSALLLATASGCGVAPGNRVAADGADPTAPAVDADSDLVETVADLLTSALALAVATGFSFAQLRPLGRRLAALHGAHLEELGQSVDVPSGEVKGSPATARARLLRAEERLQRHLVAASLDAESGALAQVFASMAAAVAQQRAVAS